MSPKKEKTWHMRCAVSFQQTRVEGNPANIHWHIPPEDYITEHQTAHK
jgi:hypothetical protein